ncbi:uncharacterized protein LOC131937024 isoform X2 [Physella acuta]|uniref:uncharacterized protein LOC131937024 isoform X2 n=1 Tax=Physella acuta TaxID=109671 RepID=UPI0027DE8054|nr:uncharacterized protein LOC131937024 isoform X2 [Physella acuta]
MRTTSGRSNMWQIVLLTLWLKQWAHIQASGVPVRLVEMCAEGQHFSSLTGSCQPCSRCDYFSVQLRACTRSTDTTCLRCLSDTGVRRQTFSHPKCLKCPPCRPGEFVLTSCTSAEKTKCARCPRGSYSVMSSYSPYCAPCTDCGNRETLQNCTGKQDTVCGQCKPGFYKDFSLNKCNRCMSCLPGEPHLAECAGGADGRLCSGMLLHQWRQRNIIDSGGFRSKQEVVIAHVSTSTQPSTVWTTNLTTRLTSDHNLLQTDIAQIKTCANFDGQELQR